MINKEIMQISKKQAGIFLLKVQGLFGKYKYSGKTGICEFTKNAGCVQYDPVDVCGKNHELVYLSRVKGFKRQLLHEALYEDRRLIDIYDKNMSIALLEDWPYLDYFRNHFTEKGRQKDEIDKISKELLEYIRINGPVCSSDIKFNKKVDWYWAPTSLARAALDTLYYRGDLIIHERRNTRKYYDLAENHISRKILDSDNPFKNPEDLIAWQILRRIKSVGLLWNRSGDALLGIHGADSKSRNNAFNILVDRGLIKEVSVEGITHHLYFVREYSDVLMESITDTGKSNRTEFIAPLDNLMWDRRLINEIFEFDYKWEIYTPESKRKYGYYVLPVLHGDKFIGRIEISKDKKAGLLNISNIWFEKDSYHTKRADDGISRCLARLNLFYFK